MLTNFTQKNSKYFECKDCDFKCCNKNDYNIHILTSKHKMLTNVDSKNSNKFICECCNEYIHRQSLSVHKKNNNETIDDKNYIKRSILNVQVYK